MADVELWLRGTDWIAAGPRIKPGDIVWDASLPGFVPGDSAAKRSPMCCSTEPRKAASAGLPLAGTGTWTPESARDEARRLLGSIASKADPAAEKRAARNAQTVAELCDVYLADAEAGRLITRRRTQKKANTIALDRGRVARHVKPLLGQLRLPPSPAKISSVSCMMSLRARRQLPRRLRPGD